MNKSNCQLLHIIINKRSLIVLIYINICLPIVNGQRLLDEYSGYIVTSGQDTITGYFLEDCNKNYSHSINFRSSVENDYTSYSPKELESFYFSSDVKFKTNIINGDFLFTRVIIEGSTSLYEYNSDKKSHFLIKINDTLVELKIRKSQNYDIAAGRVNTSNVLEYIGTLNHAFSDCPQIIKITNRLTRKDLIRVFKSYQNCTQADFKFYSKRKTKLYLGLIGGLAKKENFNYKTIRFVMILKNPEVKGSLYPKLMYNYRNFQNEYTKRGELRQSNDDIHELSLNLEIRILKNTLVQPFTGFGFGITYWQQDNWFWPKLNIDLGTYINITKSNILSIQAVGFGVYGYSWGAPGLGIGYIQRIR